MNLKKFLTKIYVHKVIVVFAALLRILPHPANVAPIAAMALFGGMYLDKRFAFVIPLLALFLSDLVLGFHDTMPFVYVGFVLSGLIGLWMRRNKSGPRVVGGILLSSLLFFMLTNFGVWLVSGMYEKNTDGLIEAFVMGLPFFRNTIVGDLLYTTAFIILYELLMVISRRTALVRVRK